MSGSPARPEQSEPPLMDWMWAWESTSGPASFYIWCSRSREEILRWVGEVNPPGYVAVEGGKYFQYRENQNSRLFLSDHRIDIARYRPYHRAPRDQRRADRHLLRAVLRGDLGPVQWDLHDGDYGAFQASGDGIESLREYLTPNTGRRKQQAQWKEILRPCVIDLRHETDPTCVDSRIAERLSSEPHSPRVVKVRLPSDWYKNPALSELSQQWAAAAPRGRWSFQYIPNGWTGPLD